MARVTEQQLKNSVSPEVYTEIERALDKARARMIGFFVDRDFTFEEFDAAEKEFEQWLEREVKKFNRVDAITSSRLARKMFMIGWLEREYA